jgi:hypothetical protein
MAMPLVVLAKFVEIREVDGDQMPQKLLKEWILASTIGKR